MDDEAFGVPALRAGDVSAGVPVHAAPALEPVGVRRAGGHALALVEVVPAGHAGRGVVRCVAAAQTLGVAALVVLRACPLPASAWAHCGHRGERAVRWGTPGQQLIRASAD
jgi:hypothetical protein